MDNTQMQSSMYYEMFMERAYGKFEDSIPTSHAYLMKNLILAEQEKITSPQNMAHFEELLVIVKDNMEEAFDGYMGKPHVSEHISNELKVYKDRVAWAVSTTELIKIVYDTIDLTLSIQIEMHT